MNNKIFAKIEFVDTFYFSIALKGYNKNEKLL